MENQDASDTYAEPLSFLFIGNCGTIVRSALHRAFIPSIVRFGPALENQVLQFESEENGSIW